MSLTRVWVVAEELELVRADRIATLSMPNAVALLEDDPGRAAELPQHVRICVSVPSGGERARSWRLMTCPLPVVTDALAGLVAALSEAEKAAADAPAIYVYPIAPAVPEGIPTWTVDVELPTPWPRVDSEHAAQAAEYGWPPVRSWPRP